MAAGLVRELLHYCNIAVRSCTRMEKEVIDYYDLTFVLKGSMVYLVNGTRYVLRDNDAIFLKPGTVRERPQGTEPVTYVSFNFRPEEGVTFPESDFLYNVISADVGNIFSGFSQSHIGSLPFASEKIICLLNFVLLDLSARPEHRMTNHYVHESIKFINEHITGRITLHTLSEHLNLSREYTATLFRRETGQTVNEYIRARKMLLAKSMIGNPEFTLHDVAAAIGYDDYNYFSRVYKAHYGLSPSQHRSRMHENTD